MKREKAQKFAIVYPIYNNHLRRIFENGKDVFCKYVGNRTIYVGKGTIIVFYVTRQNKEIYGEAKIENFEFMKPNEMMKRYAPRLFITKGELDEYRDNRSEDQEIAVFVLSNVKKYDSPINFRRPVTMAGVGLSQIQYESLFKH